MTYEPETNHPILGKFSGEPSTPSDIKRSEVAQRVNSIVSELDEMCAMARDPETADIIAGEAIGIGQARTRCELILSFLESRKPNQFRIVQNG